MKGNILSAMAAMGLMSIAGVVGSCAGGAGSQIDRLQQLKTQDSIVGVALDADPQWVLVMADSMDAAQAVEKERIAYYRALAYNKMGQKKTAEEWGKKALKSDVLQEENAEIFYDVCDLIFTTMSYREDEEGALPYAQKGLEVAKEDQSEVGRHWMAVLLHDVGYCEMRLGRIDEAEKCFSQSYIALNQIAATSNKFEDLRTLARVSYNIVDAYTSTGQYDKAKAWIESADDAVDLLAGSPQCTQAMKEDYQGGLMIQKAVVLLGMGLREEADAAYNEALTLEYANTDIGILERAAYLEKAERWNDLKQLTARLNTLSESWGTQAPKTENTQN